METHRHRPTSLAYHAQGDRASADNVTEGSERLPLIGPKLVVRFVEIDESILSVGGGSDDYQYAVI